MQNASFKPLKYSHVGKSRRSRQRSIAASGKSPSSSQAEGRELLHISIARRGCRGGGFAAELQCLTVSQLHHPPAAAVCSWFPLVGPEQILRWEGRRV